MSLTCYVVALASVRPAGYVDPEECAGCHAQISETYRRTGMGRSFASARPAATVPDFYHQASDTHFSMLSKGGKYFQRRWQIGFDGQQTNVEEREAAYVLGSGNHAKTWLARAVSGKLIELPLGWYAEQGGYWALNPGYDTPRPPSQRPITYECMFCHNAYPQVQWKGDQPVFEAELPEGIDCQRCHGPGAAHVRIARSQYAKASDIRASITNPARLSKERQMDLCMQCHLETTSTRLPSLVRRFGRGPFSYLPGQPLGDFTLSFDHAPGTGHDDKFEIAGAAYRLRQSECFLKSNGALTCTSCHDPHKVQRGAEAARRYTQICQQCHTAKNQLHVAATACTECHMPKRRTEDAVHVVMTDHRIVSRLPSSDLLAPLPELHPTGQEMYRGEVVPYYPSLPGTRSDDALYVALAQVAHGSNLTEGLSRLSLLLSKAVRPNPGFLLALGDAWRLAGQPEKAIVAYARDGSSQALRLQGAASREAGQLAVATELLTRAKIVSPTDAQAWLELGVTLSVAGRPTQARDALNSAIRLDPDMADAFHALGLNEKENGEPAFRRALQLDPYHEPAQSSLARLLTAKGRREEAVYHFSKAAALEPRDATNHYEYALTLVQMDRFDESEREAAFAIRANPELAEAHELLGGLLSRKQDFDAALHEYEEAVRIKPEFGRAQLDLAATLARRGDRNGAVIHLRLAARSSDPKIAQMAAQALQRLER